MKFEAKKFAFVFATVAAAVLVTAVLTQRSSLLGQTLAISKGQSLAVPKRFTGELCSLEESREAIEKAKDYMPRHAESWANYENRLPLTHAVRLARTGNPDAEYLIGWMYESGASGSEADDICRWFDAGQRVLGPNMVCAYASCMAQEAMGNREQSLALAAQWYRLAVEDGSTAAAAELGFMYERGSGVPLDYAKAHEWYQRAATAGDAQAMIDLGLMYEHGKETKPDFKQAMTLYEQASKVTGSAGNPEGARSQIARLWARNCALPSADYCRGETNAFDFVCKYGTYREAARLAYTYDYGEDVTPDRDKAVALYKISLLRSPLWSNTMEQAMEIGTVKQRIDDLDHNKKMLSEYFIKSAG